MGAMGKHLILELWECDVKSLNSVTFVKDLITTAAHKAMATVIDVVCHRFNPTGVTGVVVLAESHISIHTWPERAYAAVDIFTCGNTINPQDAASYLAERLCAQNSSMLLIERGNLSDCGLRIADCGTLNSSSQSEDRAQITDN